MTTHRPTMSDPVDVLAGARPTAAELDAQFSPERAVALLDRVRTAASEPIALTSARPAAPRRGRRWLAVAAVAAAASAALAVGPSLISPQSASATALSHLATTAASQDDGPIPAGKYVSDKPPPRECADSRAWLPSRADSRGGSLDRVGVRRLLRARVVPHHRGGQRDDLAGGLYESSGDSAAQAELTLSQRTRKVEGQSTRISPSSLQSSWSTDWLTTFGVAER